ncbi:MAG TPA: hypothetical protein VFZ03_02845 [Dongiaceae bacterium]
MERYLIPRGIISGPGAARAVEAGVALPLAGGPLAFTSAETIERGAGEEGERHPVDLAAARSFAPDLAEGLARTRAPVPRLASPSRRHSGQCPDSGVIPDPCQRAAERSSHGSRLKAGAAE